MKIQLACADSCSIVAVPGLGGHAFGSFKEKSGERMWLRDALPFNLDYEATDRPVARVMTYGYASAVTDREDTQSVEDIGTSLRSSLLPLAAAPGLRPIIFIAHSWGGLVVKEVGLTTRQNRAGSLLTFAEGSCYG